MSAREKPRSKAHDGQVEWRSKRRMTETTPTMSWLRRCRYVTLALRRWRSGLWKKKKEERSGEETTYDYYGSAQTVAFLWIFDAFRGRSWLYSHFVPSYRWSAIWALQRNWIQKKKAMTICQRRCASKNPCEWCCVPLLIHPLAILGQRRWCFELIHHPSSQTNRQTNKTKKDRTTEWRQPFKNHRIFNWANHKADNFLWKATSKMDLPDGLSFDPAQWARN